jgi:fatty-acyl-CoA synthase
MTDLSRATIGDLLDRVAGRFADREALVDIPGMQRYTYREFRGRVDELAKGFLKLGIQRGEPLALWAPNLSEWIITQFAAAKIGAVLVSVDTNYRLEQLEYLLKQSDARCLVMAEGLRGSEYVKMIRRLCPEITLPSDELNAQAVPELRRVVLISRRTVLPGMLSWAKVRQMGAEIPDSTLAQRQRASSDPDQVAALLYTSGTTGAPKGVMSTHFGIINTTLASAENQKITETDRLCLSVPLSHMFGCICVTLAAVIKGAALVIPSETFDPAKVLQAVEKEQCTALYGSPNSFLALMDCPEFGRIHLKSLRTGIMGGAQCPMEVMKRVVEQMGVKEIVIGYGQTEASSWISQTLPEDPLDLRVSTVGKALPNVEIKIMDPKSGREVPTGSLGEICSRGFNMKGYYKMPAATAGAIDAGGWLHTGDLGTIDGSGYLRTAGRVKEVITKAGEAIFPTEVEELLFSHSKISNVQAFGIPDKAAGEEVAVWIKPEEGATIDEEEILRYCRGKLPDSYVPGYIKFVQEFPMTPLGKVQKFRMREITVKELGLEES